MPLNRWRVDVLDQQPLHPLVIIALVGSLGLGVTALQRFGSGNPTGRAAGAAGGCAGDVGAVHELSDEVLWANPPEVAPITDRWVVRFHDEPGDDELVRLAPRRRLRMGGQPVFEVDGQAAEELAERGDVAWIEPVVRTTISYSPNDTLFGSQWNLSRIGLEAAWEISQGDGVIVAVLDTGVSRGEDGLSHLLAGTDFIDEDDDPDDEHWHGTHVAAVIAQATDNAVGASGVAPGVSILPVRIADQDGYGNSTILAEAIEWAVDNGADIINISMGTTRDAQNQLQAACDYAEERGVLVVAAAGNDYGGDVHYPAALDSVIAVGAVDSIDVITDYSNRGPEVDLVAPGGSMDEGTASTELVIQESQKDGVWDYRGAAGTSFATPHVAGVAALLYSAGLTEPALVTEALISSADTLGNTGHDERYGYGLVDAEEALGKVSALMMQMGEEETGTTSDSTEDASSDGGTVAIVDEGAGGNAGSSFGPDSASSGCQHIGALAGWGPWLWLGALGWGFRRR